MAQLGYVGRRKQLRSMTKSICKTNHILIGLGGTGGKILKAFKMRMFEEFPNAKERAKQPVSLLYVDSTDEMMGIGRPDFRVMGLDASFTQSEFLNIKAVDVQKILDNIDSYPSVKGIVNNVSAVRTAIGSLGEAAGQKRRAGRLLFAANAQAFVNAIQNAYARCDEVSHNAERTNFHIFAGLSGGTGSGAIVDAIVQTRKAFPDAIISVYAMIPEMNLPKSNMDKGRYYQNGYAALEELNALQAGRFSPHDITGFGKEASLFSDSIKGVANGLTLYSNVNENGLTLNSLEELPKIVSDYIYARVFLINSDDQVNHDIIRAYSFENMDDFALEYDETANVALGEQIPVARTKKINSFGIKRVIYPELRILKHITYTVGESVLYQFKYNNWRESFGYVNEEANKDYREIYLNPNNLAKWMLDDKHLTLEVKILPSDKDHPQFNEYWHGKAIDYAEEAKGADCPLNELDGIMSDFFDKQFRGVGVIEYYRGKLQAIPDMAKEIRHTIEHELFEKWRVGDISVIELQKVSHLLLEKITEIRKALEEKSAKNAEELETINEDRSFNVTDWRSLNILQRMINKGARLYAEHQEILTDYYTAKTMVEALEFAKALASKVFVELGNLDADISAFGQKVNDAIDETERLIMAQKKVNKGLEDMKGAVIEVSEEEIMSDFELQLKLNKTDMPQVARHLREAILPAGDFTNFGNLANSLTIETIKDAFDIKLAEIVRVKHDEMAEAEKKVLGLNILTQLQQKLLTDEDIQKFALNIVRQSGVYLKLDNDQMQLHVRNNENNLSPTNPASINQKTILVSIPSPDDNENLKQFTDKLEKAFKDSFSQSASQTTLVVNRKSPRKEELSIITVVYCFPMRAVAWLSTYKNRYEHFLNSGNRNTDMSNAILLHSEGMGDNFPSLFVSYAKENKDATTPPTIPQGNAIWYVAIDGKQTGPYSLAQCLELAGNGKLTPQSLVWKAGLAGWVTAASQSELASLFVTPCPPPLGSVPPPLG